MMPQEEAALVARVAAGDRVAFTRLAGIHLPAIEAYALRTIGDASRAQDVAQEVMLRLWAGAERFDASRARLTTWLHQIAYNLCMDIFRQGSRLSALDDGYDMAVQCDAMADNEPAPVARALALLPERQRTALVLTYYQALPNRDVAVIMGVSVRALESLLVRARKAIKHSLEEDS